MHKVIGRKRTCLICKRVCGGSTLGRHIKQFHNMSMERYYLDILHIPKPKCLVCNKTTKFIGLEHGYNKFCSQSCHIVYEWEKGNKIPGMLGKKHKEETKTAIGKSNSVAVQAYYDAGGTPHNKGDSIFEFRLCGCGSKFETKKTSDVALCGICRRSGKFNSAKRPEVRKKLSEKACERVINHPETLGSRGKRGWVILQRLGRFYYRSSLEEAALKNLNENPDVTAILKDKIRVPYTLDGVPHYYIIDLQIHTKDGPVFLVEIKPDSWLEDPLVQVKLTAGRAYAESVFCPFQIWNKKVCFSYEKIAQLLNETHVTSSVTK